MNGRRRDAATTVIVVTHEVNAILPYVDRVLYLVDGRFRMGSVEEVMTTRPCRPSTGPTSRW